MDSFENSTKSRINLIARQAENLSVRDSTSFVGNSGYIGASECTRTIDVDGREADDKG